jgi:hypothetical protein
MFGPIARNRHAEVAVETVWLWWLWWRWDTGRPYSDAMLAHDARKWRAAFEAARGSHVCPLRQKWYVDIACRAPRGSCPFSVSVGRLSRIHSRIVLSRTYKVLQVRRKYKRPRPCPCAVGDSLAIGRLPSPEMNRCAFQQACLKPSFVESFVSSHQTHWKRLSTHSKCNVLVSKALSQIMTLNSGGSLVSNNDCGCSMLASGTVWSGSAGEVVN